MSHLTQHQRYTIQVLLLQNYSKTEIASSLGKHKTVIYREIQKNCDKRSGAYLGDLAQRKYASRIKEKKKKIIFTDQIKQTVNHLIPNTYIIQPKSYLKTHRHNHRYSLPLFYLFFLLH